MWHVQHVTNKFMLEKWCEGKNRKNNVFSTKTKHVTNLSLPCFNLREQMEENNKVMNIMMIMTHTYEDEKTNVSTCMVIFEKIKNEYCFLKAT